MFRTKNHPKASRLFIIMAADIHHRLGKPLEIDPETAAATRGYYIVQWPNEKDKGNFHARFNTVGPMSLQEAKEKYPTAKLRGWR